MHPTPRACPLGSAFPPETGDESPHSGRASGARSAGPAGGPPGCAPAFPEPGTRPAARGLPAPSGARFDVRGGGQTERQSRAEAEGGTSQICSGADILSRLRQRDWLVWRGRTAGGGWGEAGQSCGLRRGGRGAPDPPWAPALDAARGTQSTVQSCCGPRWPGSQVSRALGDRVLGAAGHIREDEVAVHGPEAQDKPSPFSGPCSQSHRPVWLVPKRPPGQVSRQTGTRVKLGRRSWGSLLPQFCCLSACLSICPSVHPSICPALCL